MEKEITPIQGKKAFEVHQDILELKRQMGMAFVELGKLLKEIRDSRYFEVLGYDSFISYVINSELGFKRRTAYYYIEIYEWFIEKLKYSEQAVAQIGQDKLLRALAVLKKEYSDSDTKIDPSLKKRSDELIVEVQELRPVDFDKKYEDEKKQDGFEDRLAPPEYFRCKCHEKWILVVPIEDCCDEWLEKMRQSIDNRKVKK